MTNAEIEKHVRGLKRQLVAALTKLVQTGTTDGFEVQDLEDQIENANQLWVLQTELHLQESE